MEGLTPGTSGATLCVVIWFVALAQQMRKTLLWDSCMTRRPSASCLLVTFIFFTLMLFPINIWVFEVERNVSIPIGWSYFIGWLVLILYVSCGEWPEGPGGRKGRGKVRSGKVWREEAGDPQG